MAFISGSGIAFAARTAASGALRRGAIAAAAAGAFVALSAAVPVAQLDVGIDHVRSAKGLIRLCLTRDPDNFPACIDDHDAVTRSFPAATHEAHIDGLPYGEYAVAVIHDENGNAKLDTFAGIPREGYGFSRNAAVVFVPPKFAAARFAIESDANAQQIRMRYIF